jgi:chorismate mutase / prephenate dehydratase
VAYAPCDDITGVFAEVEKGRADYGVVPIENSTDGSITDTIDAFIGSRLRIINELLLRIRHHLLCRGERAAIQRVYSRHTVFGQCRRWLASHLPGVELVEVVSTTKAAERAAAEPHAAALASSDAATAYDLPILVHDVQDNPHNTTRFIVVGDPGKGAQPTGNDITTLMLSLQHRPGTLFESLIPFHDAGLNLLRIESRPNRQKPWEYLFFIDVAGHVHDPALAAAVERLRGSTSTLDVLGSYPRAVTALND